MAKEVTKPQEDLAPAYFVQYSALWCILLGFFVMLLSLGSTQMGPGDDGVGQVRDAFGSTGGLGLLPYAKNALFGRDDGSASSFRIRKTAPSQIAEVDGYVRGMLWQKGLSDVSMINIVNAPDSPTVVIRVPVLFAEGGKGIQRDSIELLEMLGDVLVNLDEYELEVVAVCELPGLGQPARQRIALLHSALVARLLTDVSSLSGDRVRAVGFCDSRLLDLYGMDHVDNDVLIFIRRSDD